MNFIQRLKGYFSSDDEKPHDEKLYAPLKQALLNNDYQTSSAWPEEYNKGIIFTLNRCGIICAYLNPAQKAFIDFAKNSPGPLVDIGCAYGVATRPAIANGGQIIAIDSSPEHLAILENSLPHIWKNQLQTINKYFPSQAVLPSGSVSGILASYIFPFLTPDEFEAGLACCYDWLMPGGTLWVTQSSLNLSPGTPLQKRYNERKAAAEKWPGLIDNYHDYLDEGWQKILPNNINFVEMEEMLSLLTNTGFEIVASDYYTLGFWQHLDADINDKGSYYIFARKPGTSNKNQSS